MSPVAKSVMFLLLAALVCAGAGGLQGTKIKSWYSTRTVQYTTHADLLQTVPWLYTPHPADQRNTLERSELQHVPSFYRSMLPTSNLPNKSFPFLHILADCISFAWKHPKWEYQIACLRSKLKYRHKQGIPKLPRQSNAKQKRIYRHLMHFDFILA